MPLLPIRCVILPKNISLLTLHPVDKTNKSAASITEKKRQKLKLVEKLTSIHVCPFSCTLKSLPSLGTLSTTTVKSIQNKCYVVLWFMRKWLFGSTRYGWFYSQVLPLTYGIFDATGEGDRRRALLHYKDSGGLNRTRQLLPRNFSKEPVFFV